MLQTLLLAVTGVALFLQGYLAVEALFSGAAIFSIYGFSPVVIQGLSSSSSIFVTFVSLAVTLPLFIILFISWIWLAQKRREGKVLWAVVAALWLAMGLLAWWSQGRLSNLVYLEGLRGALLTLLFLYDGLWGRRKKYLFSVRKR
jgi:hypothetical protein